MNRIGILFYYRLNTIKKTRKVPLNDSILFDSIDFIVESYDFRVVEEVKLMEGKCLEGMR